MAKTHSRIRRFTILDVDTLLSIFKDYLGDTYLPSDAVPLRFRIDPTSRTMQIEVESDTWEGDAGTLRLDFEINRIFSAWGKV